MLSMLDGSHGRRSRSSGAFLLLGGFGGDFWLVRLRLCWILSILEGIHCEVVLPICGRPENKGKKEYL